MRNIRLMMEVYLWNSLMTYGLLGIEITFGITVHRPRTCILIHTSLNVSPDIKNWISPVISCDLLVESVQFPHLRVLYRATITSTLQGSADYPQRWFVIDGFTTRFVGSADICTQLSLQKWCQSLWIRCNLKYNRRKRLRNVWEDLWVVGSSFLRPKRAFSSDIVAYSRTRTPGQTR